MSLEELVNQKYDLQDIIKEYHQMIDELKKNQYEEICEMIYGAYTVYLYEVEMK